MKAWCQQCGREYAVTPGGVVPRAATCEGCHADLHACVQCAHYDPRAYNECHESQAERVDDRRRSNFCDYFKPCAGPPTSPEAQRARAREQAGRAKLEGLFKKPGPTGD